LHAPVVLAHGLFGFERIGFGRWTLASYFRGIPDYLRSLGVRVCVPRVHPTAGIERRARKLGERIEARFPGERVHLIAHSFGGLDARQLLTDETWRRRVLTLTTIATPHLGSTLAEAAGRKLGPIYRVLRALDWDHQGFFDLLPKATRRWHEQTPPPEGVPCFSVAGEPRAEEVCWPLRRLYGALTKWEGPNDGLVSVKSSLAFGTALPSCNADHLRQMNWCTGMPRHEVWPEVREMYRRILSAIARYDPEPVAIAQGDERQAATVCVV
jgi:triacylglycerol lipase